MRRTIRIAMVLGLLISSFAAAATAGNDAAEPDTFFRNFIGLDAGQIQDIHGGKAIAKVVDTHKPEEVFVFGAVYVDSTPERYLKLASDLDALRKLPNYLALRQFSPSPQLSDLDGFTFEDGDIKDLQHCTPGHCDVQLPAEVMEQFQRSVDWSASDRAAQANHLMQGLAIQALGKYQQGGNAALGTYRDKSHPTAVAETFASLLSEMNALPVYLPELHRYLLEYPNAPSDQIQSQFYWEKVNFGLKPTLRVVQAVEFHGTTPGRPAYAVAVKQLYASHYFETALDLTVCVKDASRSGFYLITVKGSQQAGLTGFKGSIVRKVAVDKTRSSLQRALVSMKQRLEVKTDQ